MINFVFFMLKSVDSLFIKSNKYDNTRSSKCLESNTVPSNKNAKSHTRSPCLRLWSDRFETIFGSNFIKINYGKKMSNQLNFASKWRFEIKILNFLSNHFSGAPREALPSARVQRCARSEGGMIFSNFLVSNVHL